MTRLIVNADDYGLTRTVSSGIRRAHRDGIVTSTTCMMNMPGVAGDVAVAMAECPGLDLGTHLVLTAGAPSRPPASVPALVGRDGRFHKLDAVRCDGGRFPAAQVRDEWRAQIEALLAMGARPSHLDSHHHAAYLHPALYEVMVGLAGEYGLPIRNPVPLGTDRGLAERAVLDTVRRYPSVPVPTPDGMVASFMADGATVANLLAILAALPEGTVELMCHPGVVDAELMAVSTYNRPRGVELEVLTGDTVRAAVADLGIDLVGWRAVTG